MFKGFFSKANDREEKKLESFEHAVAIARRLRFCHEADELARLSKFEDEDVGLLNVYYEKGIKMALRIENYSDNEIDLILKLMNACIFRHDEFELAEQSSSYAEWQSKLDALHEDFDINDYFVPGFFNLKSEE